MSKIIGVITARMGSTRLPGKVMKELCGKPVFTHHVERMKEVNGISEIYLATSKDNKNEPLINECKKLGVKHYRGSEEDILQRHIGILEQENADAALRVTCDMPLFDTGSLNEFVKIFEQEYCDYIYVANMTMIQGTVGELISRKAMEKMHKKYKGPAISQPIKEHMGEYKTLGVDIPQELCRPEYRLTLDYPEDLEVIRFIYGELYSGEPVSLSEVYKLLDDNPQVANINRDVKVKGNVKYGSDLLDAPEYSIMRSGDKYVVLDANKTNVPVDEFFEKLKTLFPGK
ncbi:MAG: NTP transferase domain-containing protein [Candidatus Omnitrophica bacterium]|nr:NTP transferase domain-containing protein [Candidatus Omnitrophota bacterium]